MRFWLLILGAAGLCYKLSRPLSRPLEGLEALDFPVAFRDDEGRFFLVTSGEQFLNLFEVQDITDDHFKGWDSRGRGFRFVGSRRGTSAYPAVGPVDIKGLNQTLDVFLKRASDLPGWSPGQEQSALVAWRDGLVDHAARSQDQ